MVTLKQIKEKGGRYELTANELQDILGTKRVSRKKAEKLGLHVGRRFYNNGDWFYYVEDDPSDQY